VVGSRCDELGFENKTGINRAGEEAQKPSSLASASKQANKQTSKQANKQTSKQANKQTSKTIVVGS